MSVFIRSVSGPLTARRRGVQTANGVRVSPCGDKHAGERHPRSRCSTGVHEQRVRVEFHPLGLLGRRQRHGLAARRRSGEGIALVGYADEREEAGRLTGPVRVRVGSRSMSTECIVGPAGSEPLVGHLVLERLDLIADRTNRTLTPRRPNYPLLKLK